MWPPPPSVDWKAAAAVPSSGTASAVAIVVNVAIVNVDVVGQFVVVKVAASLLMTAAASQPSLLAAADCVGADADVVAGEMRAAVA